MRRGGGAPGVASPPEPPKRSRSMPPALRRAGGRAPERSPEAPPEDPGSVQQGPAGGPPAERIQAVDAAFQGGQGFLLVKGRLGDAVDRHDVERDPRPEQPEGLVA